MCTWKHWANNILSLSSFPILFFFNLKLFLLLLWHCRDFCEISLKKSKLKIYCSCNKIFRRWLSFLFFREWHKKFKVNKEVEPMCGHIKFRIFSSRVVRHKQIEIQKVFWVWEFFLFSSRKIKHLEGEEKTNWKCVEENCRRKKFFPKFHQKKKTRKY